MIPYGDHTTCKTCASPLSARAIHIIGGEIKAMPTKTVVTCVPVIDHPKVKLSADLIGVLRNYYGSGLLNISLNQDRISLLKGMAAATERQTLLAEIERVVNMIDHYGAVQISEGAE